MMSRQTVVSLAMVEKDDIERLNDDTDQVFSQASHRTSSRDHQQERQKELQT